jgi:cytochrome c oxidase subunit 2
MIAPPKINVNSVWLPDARSTLAPDVDHAWWVVMVISIFFFILVIGLVTYWGLKYKRRSNKDLTSEVDHHFQLELVWTVVPLVLVIGLFFVGAKGYMNANVPPRDAINIDVTASQWNWSFTYPNGVNESELYVPEKTNIRLTMSSKDVIHSLFIPEFRAKQDVIPGLYTTIWFNATGLGDTAIECTEYCGGLNGDPTKDNDTGHSRMLSQVHVMSEADYEAWLAKEDALQNAKDPVVLGKTIFPSKCGICHNVDGTRKVGPPLDHLFEAQVKLDDGSSVTADEAYLRESIQNSQAKIVSGFPRPSPMPPMTDLTETQLNGLIKYIESLK